jgi:hypothetical protein
MIPAGIDPMEYFNRDKPTVSRIRQRYAGSFVDLNGIYHDKGGLTNEELARGVYQAAREGKGLIVPEGYDFWDSNGSSGRIYKKRELGIDRVPFNTAIRFKRFGPEVNFVPNLSRRYMKRFRVTPRRGLLTTLSNPDVKRRMLKRAHRCLGYTRMDGHHVAIHADDFFEAQLLRHFYPDRFPIEYQYADSIAQTPSRSDVLPYTIEVYVLPVTAEGDECLVEWRKLEWEMTVKDQFFRGASTKAKVSEDPVLKRAYKYAQTEQQADALFLAGLGEIEDYSHRSDDMPSVLIKFPRARRFSIHDVLARRMIIGNEKSARRPIKLEISIATMYVLGLEEIKPEMLFDLDDAYLERTA